MAEAKWLLKPARVHQLKGNIFAASIIVEGTENLPNPQNIVFSTNQALLQQIVDDHNAIVAPGRPSTAIPAILSGHDHD